MKIFLKLSFILLLVSSHINAIGIHSNGKGINKNLYIKTLKKLSETKEALNFEKLAKCINTLEFTFDYFDKIIDQMHDRIIYLQNLKKKTDPKELTFLQMHINNARMELDSVILQRDIHTSEMIDNCFFESESFNT
jgi:hypothetical protein